MFQAGGALRSKLQGISISQEELEARKKAAEEFEDKGQGERLVVAKRNSGGGGLLMQGMDMGATNNNNHPQGMVKSPTFRGQQQQGGKRFSLRNVFGQFHKTTVTTGPPQDQKIQPGPGEPTPARINTTKQQQVDNSNSNNNNGPSPVYLSVVNH
jgi:hypothetical protein